MKSWWAALLIAFVAVAGCTSTDDSATADDLPESTAVPNEMDAGDAGAEGEESGENAEASQEGPGNETEATPEDGDNTAPTATLDADVTTAIEMANVTFTVSVADEDGDALEWQLAFGDASEPFAGTNATMNVTYAYAAAGNYTATLVVSDGTLEVNATLNITIELGTDPNAPIYEDLWVVQGPDGICHAKDAVAVGPAYIHDRPNEGIPYGAGFVDGRGTWVYEEGNGIDGMQVSADEGGDYATCVNGDILIF